MKKRVSFAEAMLSAPTFVDVETEYAKNKDLKKDEVKLLQDWVERQPHLPNISELETIHFLHSCYYIHPTAKKCIETFYTIRAHCPEFFANRNPISNASELLDVVLYVPLPKVTPEGYKIIFAKLIDTDIEKYSFQWQIKSFDMTTMLMLHQEGTYPGQIILSDLKGITFGHVAKFGIVNLKKFFIYLQDALPVRLKGVHFINIPPFMDKIMALIRPFIKAEFMNLLELHTDNLETLYKTIPQECFPLDYGGSVESVEELIEQRRNNILAHTDYFIAEEKLISDESKRLGKRISDRTLFGIEGTYRKLDID